MTTALWMVLAAVMLPYLWAVLAKATPGYDNRAPREFLAHVTGWRKRADWAQQNSFEALAGFAAAAIIAHLVVGPSARADALAIGFIAFRLLHGLLYILDKGTLRSLAWIGALGCIVGLFLVAARII